MPSWPYAACAHDRRKGCCCCCCRPRCCGRRRTKKGLGRLQRKKGDLLLLISEGVATLVGRIGKVGGKGGRETTQKEPDKWSEQTTVNMAGVLLAPLKRCRGNEQVVCRGKGLKRRAASVPFPVRWRVRGGTSKQIRILCPIECLNSLHKKNGAQLVVFKL